MTESMRETDKKLKVMAERLRLCMLRDKKVSDTAEEIRKARLLQLQQVNKDYHVNPLQRPLSAYDSAIGYITTKVQQ